MVTEGLLIYRFPNFMSKIVIKIYASFIRGERLFNDFDGDFDFFYFELTGCLADCIGFERIDDILLMLLNIFEDIILFKFSY